MDVFAPARAALATLPGETAAFASDADGHALFCEREDELFPSASVIKLPLVMTLYADATRGLIDLDERLAVGDRVDGSGVLRHIRDVERLSLRDLAMLAILEQCQDRTMLLRYLPYGAKVPHKTGTLDESRNDAAIVPGERPVIVAAFTRKLRDTGAAVSWLGIVGWCAYRAAGNPGDAL